MRRIALALLASTALVGAASAADLARKAPPPYVAVAPVQAVNWSGMYIGAFAGYGWGNTDWTGIASNSVDGWLGGGQIGFDQQFGQFVFGVQGDFAGTDIQANSGPYTNKTKWLSSATGRVGVAVDRALLYVKGGGAWEELDSAAWGTTASKTRSGWTVGGGIEYALAPHWSTFAEYNYYDFGKANTLVAGNLYNVDSNVSVVKLGVNYRFGL